MKTFRIFTAAAFAFALQCTSSSSQDIPTPAVSPDPVADVAPTTFDPSLLFHDYSWRSFIALNWPALTGAANRGMPDRNKVFGDIAGSRVWQTWKSRFEIFQPGGSPPSPWASYHAANPCGGDVSNEGTTLSSFTAFGDFNQATFSLSRLGNPLVAQNGTYARYEVRVNQPQFESIVSNKWYLAANLPNSSTLTSRFNDGSIEIKAAWRLLTAADTPEIRSRYYVQTAKVFDPGDACVDQDIALVGLHIVAKTPHRPQWIWSSFEHVDNVPPASTEPAAPAGTPLSFNNPALPQGLDPAIAPDAISAANPPVASPTPMQVVRQVPISPEAMQINTAYWALPGIKGTVWQNYMLVMTQWPTKMSPEEPANMGDPFPSSGSTLGNTTMETYHQQDGDDCMSCHQMANRRGRDFVLFVTFDAFRPSVPAPGDNFAAKSTEAQSAGEALAKDPLVQDLVNFFNAKNN